MRVIWQDLRYGARILLKQPGFTFIAVMTLALGIGANTAIFSFVNSLFLRPLHVPNPERVARLYAEDKQGRGFDVFSYPNYADLRDRSQTLQALAAHRQVEASVGLGAGAENMEGEVVTGNYFQALGVNAALGRTLLPDDDKNPGAHPVVAISHSFWSRRMGADKSAVGKKLYINSHPFTIVGVMPEEFNGSYQAFTADFWAPMMMHEQIRPRGMTLDSRGWGWLSGTARLKPGVMLSEAQMEVDRLTKQIVEEYPRVNEGISRFRLYPASALPEEFREGVSGMLFFFTAVVGLVLLAACANIAGLMLARMTSRHREIAVRQALGASRFRLIRQWLTESLMLALCGSAAGLIFALWASDGLTALAPPEYGNFSPRLQLDARVLAFTLAVSVVAGALCGLFPALRASRADLVVALNESGSAGSGGRHRSRLQQTFVVTQVAVSLVLLVVAGLLLRSLQSSAAFDPGFKTDNLLLARMDLRRQGYSNEQGQTFYRQFSERTQSAPGVRAVTSAMVVPLGSGRESRGFIIPGHLAPNGSRYISIANNTVGSNYFATMGIPLLRGRDFDERDDQSGARQVVVINETMAQRFWPNGNAVGQSIQTSANGPAIEIVGVVRDIKYHTLVEKPMPYVYANVTQFYSPDMTMHIRTSGDPGALIGEVRKQIDSLDPNLGAQFSTFAEFRQVSLFPSRAMAIVSSLFGSLALLLAAVGIYGVTSYTVGQRTREVGIRMALGAQRGAILRLIIVQGVRITLIGVGAGLVAALSLTRFLSSHLFGVSAYDPLTFVMIASLLTLVALVACWIPARRATKVDPMIALRFE